MILEKTPTLIIIGAGPKAVSLWLKAKVLKEQGWKVPEIIIIEKHGVAANWDGSHGFTNGRQLLGSPPQKDVGYPYQSLFDKTIDQSMLDYSWNNYLVENGYYADWIDKGRLPPVLEDWAKYLQWAAKKGGLKIHRGTVTKIHRRKSEWSLKYRTLRGKFITVEGDGLVITGLGDPIQLPIKGKIKKRKGIPQFLEAKDFWQHSKQFSGEQNIRIAVIGGGESAGTAIVELLDRIDLRKSQIDLYNGHASAFVRNENAFENSYFSHPGEWQNISEEHRYELIKRTRSGIFSPWVKNNIDGVYLDAWISSSPVKFKLGRAKRASSNSNKIRLVLDVYGKRKSVDYDYVISSLGFNPMSFSKLFDKKQGLKERIKVERKIGYDLSLEDFTPRLHLPMLSPLSQGIGFSELTSLGLTADRILSSYVSKG
jgi:mycobactin lysine-N-oxygenase